MDETTYIEIEYPDGTIARWALPDTLDNAAILNDIEEMLPAPDTLAL